MLSVREEEYWDVADDWKISFGGKRVRVWPEANELAVFTYYIRNNCSVIAN